jgi:Calpain family cysteine protease
MPVVDRHGRDLFFDILEHTVYQEPYDQVKVRLRSIGEKYYDADFPPEWSSLIGFGPSQLRSGIDLNLWTRFSWKRCSEIYKSLSIISDNLKPSDICQGYLGDYYFLSSVAAIAENPKRIKNMFLHHKVTKTNCYCVRLFVSGKWQEIIIDDYMPYYESELRPAFSRTSNSEAWVLLLEKAWAKVHKGYLNINDGSVNECLRDLTGAPTETIKVSDPNIWDIISKSLEKKFIMTAGSCDDSGRDVLSSIGLTGIHTYTVLDQVEVFVEGYNKSRLAEKNDPRLDNRFRKLIKMRNPWSKGEWKGDWSENSHLWSESLKKKLGYKKDETGVFFMDFNDFKKYFSDI